MRLFFFAIGFMIVGICMNLVFNNYFQLLGLKINWVLLFVIVLSFRYPKLTLAFVGILAGLFCDAHSHGIMGLYGTTFFLTILLVIQVKKILYSNTFLAISIVIVFVTIIEAWLSLTILGWFEPNLDKTSMMLDTNLILAIIHGFITPIIFQIILWAENLFLREVG